MAAVTLPTTLSSHPEAFLAPSTPLHGSSLSYISSVLSPLASQIYDVHAQRTAETRASKKRKRGQDDPSSTTDSRKDLRPWNEKDALKLSGVHTEGFGVDQVWEQVRRVVGAVEREVKRDLEAREERELGEDSEDELSGSEAAGGSDLGEEGLDYEIEGVDDDENARPSDDDDLDEMDEDEDEDEDDLNVEDEDMVDVDGEDEEEEENDKGADTPATEYVEDPNGLNDGFFSIDDFNKRSDFLERVDERGDDDGAASDEEEVDWNLDPLADAAPSKTKRKPAKDDDASDEDGPTFGDMDINAPEGASDDEEELEGGEMDDMDDLTNANNITYKDFFAPPAKKVRKNKKGRPHPHNFPAKAKAPSPEAAEDEEAPMDPEAEYNETALTRIHRDLFSDEDLSASESEGGDDDPASRPSQANLSTHERRRLALTKEISALESTLISAKPWALSGEATSASRPLNSLLEEDLAFERTGKPVPVITAEVSTSLEELIKSRILSRSFEDIYRRRPDDLAVPRGSKDKYDLPDSKSKKSLAELYEEDHLRSTTGSGKDAELTDAERKEQASILNLWNQVRADLDSLSNFTLRPKAQQTSLEIRTDVAVARMEDARPNAVSAAEGGTVETARLAPGEVFRIDEGERGEGEMLAGGRKGEVVGVEERERGEGRRARRRAKDRARKRKEGMPVDVGKGVGKEARKREGEKEVMGQLKKGGVRVIGKKGELTDVEGRKVSEVKAVGAGAYKL
ncbi:U3 small nucleolar ribonucleo protein complex, subunit Mpp10 [Elsinoe ampelina]|uniref:U3 small nucleolar ribonucleoprotein protein MPP10 n=1 Tax=Elsinoe ampelina TaxID=302913 RepID=A0A6A6GCD6_9PEZI|nr:U3 small nucleolar ribonucleo protein complex, subunit Mpp10 [Elsinoe ampelina]